MTPGAATRVLEAIGAVMTRIDPAQVAAACATIAGAGRIMAHGCGREGLMMQGFAMRLHHLGLEACMQGDMAAPPLGPGDLFIASAGPGELSSVSALMRTVRDARAEVLLLTALPDTPSAAHANQVLALPAQTMASDAGAETAMPMGSAYEGALFVLFEVMVADLARRLGQSADDMRARHTNME